MGYERVVKTYHLLFDKDDMDGFECKVKGVSMGRYLELVRMQETNAAESTMDLIEALAENMTWWNLQDDGVDVELSKEQVLKEDSDFVMKIFYRWMEVVGSVPVPLPQSSNGTSPIPEASIPMEPLSPSPSS